MAGNKIRWLASINDSAELRVSIKFEHFGQVQGLGFISTMKSGHSKRMGSGAVASRTRGARKRKAKTPTLTWGELEGWRASMAELADRVARLEQLVEASISRAPPEPQAAPAQPAELAPPAPAPDFDTAALLAAFEARAKESRMRLKDTETRLCAIRHELMQSGYLPND